MTRVLVVGMLSLVLAVELGWLVLLVARPRPVGGGAESSVQAPRGRLAPPMAAPRPVPPQGGLPAPPATAGRPPGRAVPSSGPAGLDGLPYTELLAALARMDEAEPGVRLTAGQKAAMRPVLKSLSEALKASGDGPDDVLEQGAKILTDEQVTYVTEHRMDPLPVRPGAEGAGRQVLELLQARAREADWQPPGATGDNAMRGPEDLLNGIVRLESSGRLRVSPAQARALLQPLRAMHDETEGIEKRKQALVSVLTPKQRDWVLEVHARFVDEGSVDTVPPEQLLERLTRRVE